MKKIFFVLLFAAFAMSVSPAGTLKTYTYPELSMKAPASLKINKNDFKNDFPTAGCCYVRPQAIAVMVVSGQLPDQMTMLNTMVKLTGVKLNGWMPAGQAQNDMRGWVWRREYSTVIGDKTVAYTVLGHGAKYAYLIMLCTDKTDFSANRNDYRAWRDSLSLVSSNPGKPR